MTPDEQVTPPEDSGAPPPAPPKGAGGTPSSTAEEEPKKKKWKPAKGQRCRFRYLTNGPALRLATAEIVKVHPKGLLDLRADINGKTVDRLAVCPAEDDSTANVWLAP